MFEIVFMFEPVENWFENRQNWLFKFSFLNWLIHCYHSCLMRGRCIAKLFLYYMGSIHVISLRLLYFLFFVIIWHLFLLLVFAYCIFSLCLWIPIVKTQIPCIWRLGSPISIIFAWFFLWYLVLTKWHIAIANLVGRWVCLSRFC